MADVAVPSPQVIIAGYGLPGRAVVQKLIASQTPYCVIELNPGTVARCVIIGARIIAGDCADPSVLEQAGIVTASLLLVTIPDELAAIECARQARRLNPGLRIVVRCRYVSTGIEAHAAGADETIVAEQLVAEAFAFKMDAR